MQPLVLLAEVDLVAHSATSATGYATMLQADVEPVQGVHLIATGENMRLGGTSTTTSWSGWLGAGWFFTPHAGEPALCAGRAARCPNMGHGRTWIAPQWPRRSRSELVEHGHRHCMFSLPLPIGRNIHAATAIAALQIERILK